MGKVGIYPWIVIALCGLIDGGLCFSNIGSNLCRQDAICTHSTIWSTSRFRYGHISKSHVSSMGRSTGKILVRLEASRDRKGKGRGSSSSSSDMAASASAIPANDSLQSTVPISASGKEVPFPIVLWRFTRPHTLIGSALAIPAIHLLAAPSLTSVATKHVLYSLAYSMIPALLMNVFITGLNQITDVEIDKINKPYLPIAAGDLSKGKAIAVVLACLVGSLWIGSSHPRYTTEGLAVALWGSAILGTMYSLEPFRLKRFPILAALCIVAVRGTIINAGFYAHSMAAAFGNTASTSLGCLLGDQRCLLSSLYFCIFGIVIALMKDVPDAKGDEIHKIRTFTVRIGQVRIFNTMRRLITALFICFGFGFVKSAFTMVLSQTESWHALRRGMVGLASIYAGFTMRREGLKVDAKESQEVYSYYMLLWKWFYLSYLALPLAR